jgi:hypothetical protein
VPQVLCPVQSPPWQILLPIASATYRTANAVSRGPDGLKRKLGKKRKQHLQSTRSPSLPGALLDSLAGSWLWKLLQVSQANHTPGSTKLTHELQRLSTSSTKSPMASTTPHPRCYTTALSACEILP